MRVATTSRKGSLMYKTASDSMASVIILTTAAVVLLVTISAYTAYAATFSVNGRTDPNNSGFTTRSQGYWADKRASGVLGSSSGSGGTAMSGRSGGGWGPGSSRETSGDY